MEKYWGEKQKQTPIKKTGGESNEKHISVQDNKIYFYSGVNRNACSELNKKISELESKATTLANNLSVEPPPIKLSLTGLWFRMNDKIQRLKTLLMSNRTNAVQDEPMEDAYLDVSNYGIMATIVKNGKWGK